jgi:hypothetical protein
MREIEVLIAEVHPKPDVPSRVRALPRPKQQVEPTEVSARPVVLPRVDPPRPQGKVTPLAPRRYKLEVTLPEETYEKLRQLQDLLSHQVPGGDPAKIVDRALDELLEKTLKQRAALTHAPSKNTPSDAGRSRAIPAEVRRQVWKRDSGRCAFVDDKQHRCRETRFIEFHHVVPYGKGGAHTAGNIELRCAAHNAWQAELDYGKAFIERKQQPPRVSEATAPHYGGGVVWMGGAPELILNSA